MGSPDRLIALGRFGAPQGVRGEIRIQSYTADPAAVGGYGALTDAAGARRFAVKIVRALRDDLVIARVDGVATREAAAELTGVEIYVRRSQLPPPAADEFYNHDLIGLAAITADGATLGRVQAVLNYGAGDILEIAPHGGGETLLLPFTRAAVPEIDFAAGRLVVAPPADIEPDR